MQPSTYILGNSYKFCEALLIIGNWQDTANFPLVISIRQMKNMYLFNVLNVFNVLQNIRYRYSNKKRKFRKKILKFEKIQALWRYWSLLNIVVRSFKKFHILFPVYDLLSLLFLQECTEEKRSTIYEKHYCSNRILKDNLEPIHCSNETHNNKYQVSVIQSIFFRDHLHQNSKRFQQC